MTIDYEWHGAFTNDEINALHAEALKPFYFDACGFTPTNAGLIALQQ